VPNSPENIGGKKAMQINPGKPWKNTWKYHGVTALWFALHFMTKQTKLDPLVQLAQLVRLDAKSGPGRLRRADYQWPCPSTLPLHSDCRDQLTQN
jgi:hypothetical protein